MNGIYAKDVGVGLVCLVPLALQLLCEFDFCKSTPVPVGSTASITY